MSTNRSIGTLILGAAAAYAAYKYSKLSEEEKQRIANKLKGKYQKVKQEAEASLATAKSHFNDLKTKAGEVIREKFPNAEKDFGNMFKSDPGNTTPPGGSGSQFGV